MPRLSRAVPKYGHHKSSGQAVVKFAGQPHYLGVFGSPESRDKYDRLIAEYLACGRNPHLMNAGGEDELTVDELLLAFADYAAGYYQKHGHPTSEFGAYRQVIRAASALYGNLPISEFGPRRLKAVRQSWLDKGQARSTINRNQRRLVRIFKWGVSEELLDAGVWRALSSVEGLRKGRSEAAESVPVPPVGMDRVQAVIPLVSPIVADMIRMQLMTGMRPGEVCVIRPADVDRSADVWEFRVDGHKTEHHDRDRVVYIGPQAKKILSPYLFRDPLLACFSPFESKEWHRVEAEKRRKTPPSCGNARGRKHDRGKPAGKRQPGKQFTTGTYGRSIGDACKKAWPAPAEVVAAGKDAIKKWHDANRWTPNQIRHTRATEIRRDHGLEAAQVILGHASANVTQIYAERDAEKAKDVIRQIG